LIQGNGYVVDAVAMFAVDQTDGKSMEIYDFAGHPNTYMEWICGKQYIEHSMTDI
jgi:hypothetical protein